MRVLLIIVRLLFLLMVGAVGRAWAGDCSGPDDCQATSGYLSVISVAGGLAALGAGLFALPRPGTPEWETLHPEADTPQTPPKTPPPQPDLRERGPVPPTIPAPDPLRPQGELSLDKTFNEPSDAGPQRPVGDVTLYTPPSDTSGLLTHASDALGVIDENWKNLKEVPVPEGDATPWTAGQAAVDLAQEWSTHPLTTEQMLEGVAGVEAKLLVSDLPVVGTAANILDPVLHAADLPGIGDVASDIGRAFVYDAYSELPDDWQALQQILSMSQR